MSLQDYRKKVESEPQNQSGFYLKPNEVKVGDQVAITKAEVVPPRKVKGNDGKEYSIDEKIEVTGTFIPVGKSPTDQEVKVNVSKAQAKKLFALWKDQPWEGKKMMVTQIVTKPIKGESRTWIEWTGLP